MTVADASVNHHPAPGSDRASGLEISFGLVAGPLAWFVQLCTGYAMSSWPCFPWVEPLSRPPARFAWTSDAMVVVSLTATLIALTSFVVSRRIFARIREEDCGHHPRRLTNGGGKTRFLALWGMAFGAGSAAAIAMNTVAFFVLPRCAG